MKRNSRVRLALSLSLSHTLIASSVDVYHSFENKANSARLRAIRSREFPHWLLATIRYERERKCYRLLYFIRDTIKTNKCREQ